MWQLTCCVGVVLGVFALNVLYFVSTHACTQVNDFICIMYSNMQLICFFVYKLFHIFQRVSTSSTVPPPGEQPTATRTGSVADTHDTLPLGEGTVLNCKPPEMPQDSQDPPEATLEFLTQPDSPPKEPEDPPQAFVVLCFLNKSM